MGVGGDGGNGGGEVCVCVCGGGGLHTLCYTTRRGYIAWHLLALEFGELQITDFIALSTPLHKVDDKIKGYLAPLPAIQFRMVRNQ